MAAALSEGEPAGKKQVAAQGSEGGGEEEEGASPAVLAADDGSVGLPYWERQRCAWVSGGEKRQQRQQQRPVIDPDANYDDLLLTNEPFAVPIPLPEMVDFLVDTWIDDGLY